LRRKLCIEFNEAFLTLGYVVFMENRFHRTFRNTRFTVNAFFGVNINHLLAFIETLYRANDNTIGVLTCKTWFANYVGHEDSPLLVAATGENHYTSA